MGKYKSKGRKWDPEFMELLPQCVSLDEVTGKLTCHNIYANVVLNFGWRGGVIPIPYSHVVWFLKHGRWPAVGNHIHHLNDDTIDNRPGNLDEETEAENQAHRRGRIVNRNYGKNSKYGYGMYVYYDKRDDRYYVTRYLSRGHGKGDLKTIKRGLGGFDTLAEAEAQIKIWVEKIKINGLDWMPESIGTRLSKRSIMLRKMTNRIRRWRSEGKTLAEIKSLTGFSEGTLHKVVVDMRIDKRLDKQVGYRLTAEQIPGIRQEHADGATLAALGRKYGVTAAMISDIVHRRAWKHI
jgi:hypothetical protein